MKTCQIILISIFLLFCQTAFAQTAESSITIKANNGKFTVSGVVWNEQRRNDIIAKIKNQLANNADINLSVSYDVIPFENNWQTGFDKALSKVKSWKTGILIFSGKTNESSGFIPQSVLKDEILLIDEKEKIKLADFKNELVVLLLIEAWCGPCIEQADKLDDFSKEFLSEKVNIIGVSSDSSPGERSDFRKFAARKKYNYRLGWIELNTFKYFAELNNFQGIPQTILIYNGKIIGNFLGSSPRISEEVQKRIINFSENNLQK